MSVATLSMPPLALPWFKTPFGHWDWIRAARMIWEWFKLPAHNGETRFKYKDWELAQIHRVSRRTIQAALYFLEHVAKVIRRYKEYGHRAGRVIEITVPLAGPKPKPRPKDRAPARPAPGPGSIPNVPPIPETTPEQLAAAAAAQSAAEGTPDDSPDDELDAQTRAFLEASKARREAEAAKKAAKAARQAGGMTTALPPAGKKSADQQKAELDAFMRSRPVAEDPNAPRPARE